MHVAGSSEASNGSRERVAVVVIHGVGEAEPGWINDYIVDRLGNYEPEMRFDRQSEVYRLPDTGRPHRIRREEGPVTLPRDQSFMCVMRSARLGDRGPAVSFAELHWADISNVGRNAFTRMLTTLRLFFEAPYSLGLSFMPRGAGGAFAVIRWLVLFAIETLRWPIAGLHIAIFSSAFLYLALSKVSGWLGFGATVLQKADVLPLIVIALLALVAGTSTALARRGARDDLGLASLGTAGAIFSVVLIAVIVLAAYVVPYAGSAKLVSGWLSACHEATGFAWCQSTARGVLNSVEVVKASDAGLPATYLAAGGWIIMAVWVLWNVAMVATVALIGLIWLYRRLGGSTGREPLVRPACAAGLAIIQSILWKLIICPVSIVVILLLVPNAGQREPAWPVGSFFGVDDILVRMVLIGLLNTLGCLLIAIAVWLVVARRNKVTVASRASLTEGAKAMPRLIANPAVLAFLLVLNVSSVTFYYVFCQTGDPIFKWMDDLIASVETFPMVRSAIVGGALTTASALAGPFVGMLTEASRGIAHIARDLVDHHYAPRRSFLRTSLLGRTVRDPLYFPRRARLQARLHTLLSEVIVPARFDRVVFLTHSQGTVILHEYLKSKRDGAALGDVSRIDVITLASPVSHIYQHYFRDYGTATPAAELNPRLRSWTNMWRIDDPIGDRVDAVAGGFVDNITLPEGGHTNYWKEPPVCQVIMETIRGRRAGPAAPAA